MRRLFALVSVVLGVVIVLGVAAVPIVVLGYDDSEQLVIQGPQSAFAGDLVVLQAAGVEKGARFVWLYEASYGLSTMECREQHSLGMATRHPGVYTIYLVVHRAGGVEAASHTITLINDTIPSPPIPPPPIPPPPIPPPPIPPPPIPPPPIPPPPIPPIPIPPIPIPSEKETAYQALAAECAGMVASLDLDTTQKLIDAWVAIDVDLRASVDLETAAGVLKSATAEVMAGREGSSLTMDWLDSFRRPLDAKLGALVRDGLVENVGDFADCVQTIVGGLKDVVVCVDCSTDKSLGRLQPVWDDLPNMVASRALRISTKCGSNGCGFSGRKTHTSMRTRTTNRKLGGRLRFSGRR